MQIYEKLILYLQIEQDFIYPVGRTASKSFYNYNSSKQITYRNLQKETKFARNSKT